MHRKLFHRQDVLSIKNGERNFGKYKTHKKRKWKKVTVEKIFTNITKRNSTITYEDLQHILDKMVIHNILHENGSGVSRTYLIPEDPD